MTSLGYNLKKSNKNSIKQSLELLDRMSPSKRIVNSDTQLEKYQNEVRMSRESAPIEKNDDIISANSFSEFKNKERAQKYVRGKRTSNTLKIAPTQHLPSNQNHKKEKSKEIASDTVPVPPQFPY